MKTYIFIRKILTVKLVIFLFGLIGGAIIGVYYEHGNLLKDLAVINPIRESDPNYKLIHPLLSYVIPDAEEQKEFGILESKVNNLVGQKKSNKEADKISLYFNALDEGRWIGVGETEQYNPASLLKVVIMLSYFKKAENDPSILAVKKVYIKEINDYVISNKFETASSLVVGKEYSAEELIGKMIINSDNKAMYLLLADIDNASLESIYETLGIKAPDNLGNIVISPRLYSLFFRILYNATYINREMSEKALELLSQTSFKDGMVAGVPPDTIVAHKFGEYVVVDNGVQEGVELHDCGIVYFKLSPYFLCIMTQGKDIENLKNVIKNISQLIYQNFQLLKGK